MLALTTGRRLRHSSAMLSPAAVASIEATGRGNACIKAASER